MGYVNLSIGGSDMAGDGAIDLEEGIVRILNKLLKKKQNAYNTDGVINVSMIYNEIIIPTKYWKENGCDLKLLAITKVIPELKKEIKKLEKVICINSENKNYHINTYKGLLKRLENFSKE